MSLLLVACGGPASTEIVVVVVSDSFPLEDVVIETQSSRRTPGPQAGPFSFVVQPLDGQLPRVAEVLVRGTTSTRRTLTAQATADFVTGEARRMVLRLDAQCAPPCNYGPLPTEPVARGRELDLDAEPRPEDAGSMEDVGTDAGDTGPPVDTGPPIDAGPPDQIVDVAVSDAHTCVRWASGQVRCWGGNGYGQLGDGTTDFRPLPGVSPLAIENASAIEVGSAYTCALQDGDAWCWGANAEGMLGVGTLSTGNPTPTRVGGGYDRLFAIRARTCATRGAATECWGKESLGLPLMTTACTADMCAATPQEIPELAGIVAIDGNSQFVCAAFAGRAVMCAGDDDWGNLGDGGSTMPREEVFAPVAGVMPPSDRLATAERTVCAVSDGNVYCWGANDAGQAAQPEGGHNECRWLDRTADCLQAPAQVSGLDDIVEIVAAREAFCARDRDGAVFCWGSDEHGQIGDGAPSGRIDCLRTDVDVAVPCAREPHQIAGLTAVALGASGSHLCAVTTIGELHCWGDFGGVDAHVPMRIL